MASASLFPVSENVSGLELEAGLEEGRILLFAPGSMPLPSEPDLDFLRRELGAVMSMKNISFHPEGGYLSGIRRDPVRKAKTTKILEAHSNVVRAFLGKKLPGYAASWRLGKVNFRPLQERGRTLSRHSSNERVHVDAFASGATHGGRTLRFFTNIHPEETRIWRSSGLFGDLHAEFAAKAGIAGVRLHERPIDRLLTGTLRTVASVFPPAELADTSPYDRAMRRMHDTLKDDDAFQNDPSRSVQLAFPPWHSWAVLTDLVSHAVISGQHALVNTFTVPLAACRRPELAPYHVIAAAS
jgi:hypothetical protein